MNKLIVGQYLPGESFIHKLDPRTKLIIAFAFIMVIFLANNWQTYGILMLFILGSISLSKIPLTFFIKGLRPLLLLIIITIFFQILFMPGERILVDLGFMTITWEGLLQGFLIFLRFVLIIFMSTLLTLTTQPLSIADGLESLMTPLKKLRFPVHEIALILSIALRFVPTLMEETEKIMNAQKARGVVFDEGSLKDQIMAVVPLLIPLFISAINRAEELAIAMSARGYRDGDRRTKYRVITFSQKDLAAMLAFACLLVLVLTLRA